MLTILNWEHNTRINKKIKLGTILLLFFKFLFFYYLIVMDYPSSRVQSPVRYKQQ